MASPSLQMFTLALGFLAIGCSDPESQPIPGGGPSGAGGTSLGGATGGSPTSAQTSSSVGGPTSGGSITGGASSSGASSSGALSSGALSTGAATTVSTTTAGNTAGGIMTASSTMGGNSTNGNPTTGNPIGGNTAGGIMTASNTSAGGASGSTNTTEGSTTGGDPTAEPDCDAQMPGGGQQHSGNGTGGEGNLAWEIWSNTGQGELTTFDTPAFIASWNNAGGYLGRLGFEWARFGDTPVPHDQVGTITAQFVSRKSGSAGGYSYVGMYGWTTNPCVEWYVVEDSYNNMPINPGNTTNEGEVEIDGGTYIMYTRPTTGTGGSRCSGASNWIQYYSVRRTARACGVISLTEHFNAWQGLGMDMSGELLEAKILVEVGGGVGNVELPIANVTVQ